ncbi:colicin V synthesis protein [Halarcobacter mediterraneus]|uniref:Colicin V synthesis protein n=1 Tax=Halarcobacter mediterraneus TaxID=2023153 RepID=A0A4Q1B0P4_9BACT|nr:CvpA family protein [Halarcobacter mediterraneus]RXK13871.1 colicin V synthesis protein [Halarcobacter mediterraneus]
MQEFTAFDIVILSITLLLGLKGLMKGFIKEVFGLIGIIGGIFIASRMSEDIGNLIAPILALENNATIHLIGFIVGLIGFWIILYIIGIIISNIFSASGLGIFDRILGFVFGSAKVFFIFSVITYAIYQIESFQNLMNEKVSNSMTFPLLVDTGSFIVKLDPADFTKPIEEKLSNDDENLNTQNITEEAKKTFEDLKTKTNEAIDSTKEAVNQEIEKATKEAGENIVNSISEESKKEEGN